MKYDCSIELNVPHGFRSATVSQRAAIAKVCYRKSPRDTCRTVKLKLTLTLVLTLTNAGGTVLTLMLGYRGLYIYMAIATFAIADLCNSGLSPPHATQQVIW